MKKSQIKFLKWTRNETCNAMQKSERSKPYSRRRFLKHVRISTINTWIIFVVCAAITMVSVPVTGYASEISQDNGTEIQIYSDGDYSFYSKDAKTAVIQEYWGNAQYVKVPQTLSANGRKYTVTAIGGMTFSGCVYGTIELPETIEKLEKYAFYGSCTDHIYLPKSITQIDGPLTNDWIVPRYWCWKDSFAGRYISEHSYADVYFLDSPPEVSSFEVKKSGSREIEFKWEKSHNGSGYAIVSCSKDGKNEKRAAVISDLEKTSCKVKNLKSDKVYYFRICTVNNYQGNEYCGEYSPVLAVRTKPPKKEFSEINKEIARGYQAKITKKQITLPTSVVTTYDSENFHYEKPNAKNSGAGSYLVSHTERSSVSQLANFWDSKWLYNLVCSSDKTVYIIRCKAGFKKKSMLKIKKKYPLMGDVVCDKKGNYYMIWGREDKKGKGNFVTMAVSKYSYSGKHIKTVKYKTPSAKRSDSFYATQKPFANGGCSAAITDGVLVCIYASQNYTGWNSDQVIAVNTSKMTKNEDYVILQRNSHDQRVIPLKNGGVCYAKQLNDLTRGFSVRFDQNEEYFGQDSFHFYGERGDHFGEKEDVQTNAWLGGVCETTNGILLCGASAKSMTSRAWSQGRNLFLQLIDESRTLPGSKTRKGSSGGTAYIDRGVKWLTNYPANYEVANPKIVKIEKDRLVVLWEKKYKDPCYGGTMEHASFIESYYMVLAEDGTILQKATPMNKTRLASFEDPLYKNGKLYWTVTENVGTRSKNPYLDYNRDSGKKASVCCLEIGALVKK